MGSKRFTIDALLIENEDSSSTTTVSTKADKVAKPNRRQNIKTVSGKTPVLHPLLQNVHLKLEMRELWLDFHRLGTEMIVTKSGRSVVAPTYCTVLLYFITIVQFSLCQ